MHRESVCCARAVTHECPSELGGCGLSRSQPTGQKGTRGMEVCHVESAVFDDPNLVSCAGLGPVVALAEQCGLPQLVAAQLTLPAKAGVNARRNVPSVLGARTSPNSRS